MYMCKYTYIDVLSKFIIVNDDIVAISSITTFTILVYRCGFGSVGKSNRRTSKFATTTNVPFAVGSFGQQQWKRKIIVSR